MAGLCQLNSHQLDVLELSSVLACVLDVTCYLWMLCFLPGMLLIILQVGSQLLLFFVQPDNSI